LTIDPNVTHNVDIMVDVADNGQFRNRQSVVMMLRVSRRRPYPALLSIRKLMDDWGLLSLQTWLHSQTLLEVLCRMEVVLMVECYLLRTWRWAGSITYRRGRMMGGCIEVR